MRQPAVVDLIDSDEAGQADGGKYELSFPEVGQIGGLSSGDKFCRMANGVNGCYPNGNQRGGSQQKDEPDYNKSAFEYFGGKHRGRIAKKCGNCKKIEGGFVVRRPYFEGAEGQNRGGKTLFLGIKMGFGIKIGKKADWERAGVLGVNLQIFSDVCKFF